MWVKSQAGLGSSPGMEKGIIIVPASQGQLPNMLGICSQGSDCRKATFSLQHSQSSPQPIPLSVSAPPNAHPCPYPLPSGSWSPDVGRGNSALRPQQNQLGMIQKAIGSQARLRRERVSRCRASAVFPWLLCPLRLVFTAAGAPANDWP